MQKFLMLMDDQRPLTEEVIKRHVEHLKALQQNDRLVLCGPLVEGGGMVLLLAANKKEARQIAESDPFIKDGYKTYTIRTLIEANEENNYLTSGDAP